MKNSAWKCNAHPRYPRAINLTTSTQTRITMKTDIIRGIKICKSKKTKENITYGNKVNPIKDLKSEKE